MSARSLQRLLDEQARQQGDQPFLCDPKSTAPLGYAACVARVRQLASAIADAGVSPGESVAYAFGNSERAACVLLALFYGGFRAVAVNLVAGRAHMGFVLAHSRTRLVITDNSNQTLIDAALQTADYRGARSGRLPAPPVWSLDDAGQPPALDAPMSKSDMRTEPSDALLMYTSGTTGRPKGVRLSAGNLLAGGRNTCLAHQLEASDRALCVLPLYHINGLCVTLMAPLVSGGSVVIPKRFSASMFWRWIDDYRCTWFSVVPTQVSYLLHSDPTAADGRHASLRFGRSASAPLAPEMHEAFEKRFNIPLIETMGLTETAAQILANPLPPGKRKVGSPGIAFGDEVIIADTKGRPLPADVEGELLVRGDNVMQGYFDDAEQSAGALIDGWLHTGDLGQMDDEGYVYITGRLKELIIKGGENIAPREIDEALYRHADVIEAAAFGRPCDNYGQRVEAAVVVREGADVSEADLIALCRDLLGDFKAPDKVYVISDMPKGPSGKIQRRTLADRFTAD